MSYNFKPDYEEDYREDIEDNEEYDALVEKLLDTIFGDEDDYLPDEEDPGEEYDDYSEEPDYDIVVIHVKNPRDRGYSRKQEYKAKKKLQKIASLGKYPSGAYVKKSGKGKEYIVPFDRGSRSKYLKTMSHRRVRRRNKDISEERHTGKGNHNNRHFDYWYELT